MALIETYVSPRGNTINIYDDYIAKTPEERDKIWARVERIASEALIQQEMKRQYEARQNEKRA